MENSTGSSDEQEATSSSDRGKRVCHRHTNEQTQYLESFFKQCPHPDENQKRHLSRELGLDAKQIKFWFQNKRTQAKAQTERADNSVLRAENDRIQCENIAIREALKNVICPACGGPPFGEEERKSSLQKLKLENAQLKEEYEKVSALLANCIGKPISALDPPTPFDGSTRGTSTRPDRVDRRNSSVPYRTNGISDLEKALMSETAVNAMTELMKLLRVNEPLWIESPTVGKNVINRESYEKMFPKASHFRSASARFEGTRNSVVVSMSASQLVGMLLDPDKWVDLFPVIVSKSKMLQVVEPGYLGNYGGSLQLMYEQMHILSPLVAPREFYFLRYCKQMEPGVWVMVDVSYDLFKDIYKSPFLCWKLPSGCIIQDSPNGCSKVTWIEHVEVEDKSQTHKLYKDIINGGIAYGAERWTGCLQRMCERLALANADTSSTHDIGQEAKRRIIMKVAQQMVKNFSERLSMTSNNLDFSQLSEASNNGIRISARSAFEIGNPNGTIVNAATSLWLPSSPNTVFDFFKDVKSRAKWDVVNNGNQVHEVANIYTGAHPGNSISVLRPASLPPENYSLILQENYIDNATALVVFAPIDLPSLMNGDQDQSNIRPVLPSGFMISRDGGGLTGMGNGGDGAHGSLLTVAFQMLVATEDVVNMESTIANVNAMISTAVQRIKAAFDCSDLD